MGRCIKYPDEDECHGHDCIDRIGTPCFYDRFMKAGTEDIEIEEEEDESIRARPADSYPDPR